jgi:hypothetical protein
MIAERKENRRAVYAFWRLDDMWVRSDDDVRAQPVKLPGLFVLQRRRPVSHLIAPVKEHYRPVREGVSNLQFLPDRDVRHAVLLAISSGDAIKRDDGNRFAGDPKECRRVSQVQLEKVVSRERFFSLRSPHLPEVAAVVVGRSQRGEACLPGKVQGLLWHCKAKVLFGGLAIALRRVADGPFKVAYHDRALAQEAGKFCPRVLPCAGNLLLRQSREHDIAGEHHPRGGRNYRSRIGLPCMSCRTQEGHTQGDDDFFHGWTGGCWV